MSSKKESLGMKVYESFIKRISSGEWKPGDRLPSEAQLREEYDCSRVTIREALQKLSALGLVETRQGRGSCIKPFGIEGSLLPPLAVGIPSKEDILHLLEYRRIIETSAIKLAAERAGEADMELLANYAKTMGENVNDLPAFARYDSLFHQKLMQMTGNPFIAHAGNIIRELTENAINQTLTPKDTADSVIIHTKIAQAIKKGDTKTSIRLLTNLLDSVEADVKKSLEDK